MSVWRCWITVYVRSYPCICKFIWYKCAGVVEWECATSSGPFHRTDRLFQREMGPARRRCHQNGQILKPVYNEYCCVPSRRWSYIVYTGSPAVLDLSIVQIHKYFIIHFKYLSIMKINNENKIFIKIPVCPHALDDLVLAAYATTVITTCCRTGNDLILYHICFILCIMLCINVTKM